MLAWTRLCVVGMLRSDWTLAITLGEAMCSDSLGMLQIWMSRLTSRLFFSF